MTAAEVKEALRARHPATQKLGAKTVPGVWTCVEEWQDIDLVAFSAYKHPPTGAQRRAAYPRVGYEVKVSRSDLRRELLSPGKRRRYLQLCHEFYLAVPAGLLRDDELAYVEPDWQPGDFERDGCPERCRRADHWMTKRELAAAGLRPGLHLGRGAAGLPLPEACGVCGGRGYVNGSVVEQQAPYVWVPRDVGLVVVADGRCRVVRKSPVNLQVAELSGQLLGDLVRWASARPDPRHVGVVQAARQVQQRRRRG